jgi:hypothetical protein
MIGSTSRGRHEAANEAVRGMAAAEVPLYAARIEDLGSGDFALDF